MSLKIIGNFYRIYISLISSEQNLITVLREKIYDKYSYNDLLSINGIKLKINFLSFALHIPSIQWSFMVNGSNIGSTALKYVLMENLDIEKRAKE